MSAIGFIGAGNMATAILRGYLAREKAEVYVYDIDPQRMEKLAAFGAKPAESAAWLARRVKYLFLAVKPQNFEEVLAELKGQIAEDTVVVSIAAGISSAYLKQALGFDAKVVRVMPNTPLMLGYGASALARVEPATEEEFAFCCGMFQASGETAVIDEAQMNAVISVNGSTPAYLYQIAQHFIRYAEEQGIGQEVALRLFAQTMIGSAKMMTDSGLSLDELIRMVSSKGGTTIAGLEAFREDGLEAMVRHACERCTRRAEELAR